MKLKLFLISMAALLLSAGMASATTYECDSCSSCDTAIAGASNGDIIQLNKSIVATSADCLSGFATDNITVDCQGFSILSDPGSGNNRFAIWSNAGNDFIKIKNCLIGNSTDGFTAGVFMSFSTGSIIEDSVMQKVNTGILFSSSAESNNTVDNVTIEADSTGIIFFGDEKFNIVNNSIISSKGLENIAQVGATPSAIFFTGGGETENTFYNNIFNASTSWANAANQSENANTTKSNTTNIIGGSQIGGNFWAAPDGTGYSQTCDNLDNDSFCDSPYDLGDGNFDYLPLTNNYSEEPVSELLIDWLTPVNNSVTTNTYIYWSVNLSEAPVSCDISINGAANVSMTIDGSICHYNATSLANATEFCAVVSASDLDESNVSGTQCATTDYDITPPNITIYSPAATAYSNANISLAVAADEAISAWWYSLNAGPNQAFTPNLTVQFDEGLNNLTVFANDTSSNIGFASVSFTVDSFAPTLSIVSPVSTPTYATTSIPLELTAGGGYVTVWYSLNNGSNVTYTSPVTLTGINGTTNTLNAWVNDSFGRETAASVSFLIDIEPFNSSAARLLGELVLLIFSIILLISMLSGIADKNAITVDELMKLGMLIIVMIALIAVGAGII